MHKNLKMSKDTLINFLCSITYKFKMLKLHIKKPDKFLYPA